MNCYSAAAVSGNSIVGGLIGRNYRAKVKYCYAVGKPTGVSSVGGLCGSVNTGGDFEDTGNFWDRDASEMATSAMGTGKTTAEMQTLATFVDAGWDFGETWAICEGTNYPRLRWSIPETDWVCPDGVGVEDLHYLAELWLMDACTADNTYCGGGDVDRSGVVDMADWAVLATGWLTE
jgi:hypothetical protein